MSSQSNINGRAFEFACLISLEESIKKFRPITVERNKNYFYDKDVWDSVSAEIRDTMLKSANAAANTLFDCEPLIIEKSEEPLALRFLSDSSVELGDVRDIVISNESSRWEIGLSIKHNHFAVKHSRLAKNLDFGKQWYGIKCSNEYWNDINPIFYFLDEEKSARTRRSDISDKGDKIYVPLLRAFINEVKRQYNSDKTIPKKMTEYLLGKYDFYKVVSADNKRMTEIIAFNLRGTLNRSSKFESPKIEIPTASLPTRIVRPDFKPESKTTVELYMDEGWQFSFRIHSASTYVEPSLKFDAQIIGMPKEIITVNSIWR
ncbi:MAG: HaeIII family restriction endonuclease [Firmicutes bacterium]|nr:HaeIII family restriction endonuclease [Bacillota bacterium]